MMRQAGHESVFGLQKGPNDQATRSAGLQVEKPQKSESLSGRAGGGTAYL